MNSMTAKQQKQIEDRVFKKVRPSMRVETPFYWHRVSEDSAPSGWYQWSRQQQQFTYLGESVL